MHVVVFLFSNLLEVAFCPERLCVQTAKICVRRSSPLNPKHLARMDQL